MIAWLQPAALWGLVLLSVPVAIHLLRARNAPTIPFPNVRFVRATAVASVRMGRPSDLLLLALRIAIVATAVLAMAQPLFLSGVRLDAWNARIARAIVVDASDSMRQPDRAGRSAAVEANDLAETEARSATAHVRIQTPNLHTGIQRAARWLETAPPARREIVVLSDFQLGAVDDGDVAAVPASVGLRLVPVGEILPEQPVTGLRLLAGPGEGGRTQQIHLSGQATRATLQAEATLAGDARREGLRFITKENRGEEQRLLRALARAGTFAPRADRPIAVSFGAAAGGSTIGPIREPWMLQTILRLEEDAELHRIAREMKGPNARGDAGWTVLVEDDEGNSVLRAAAVDRELLLDVGAPIGAYFSAAVVRAALLAAHGPLGRPEQERLRIPTATLSAWNRAPESVGANVWRHSDSSDARWFWAVALVLMGLEGWLRRLPRARAEDTRAAA